jgi:hypothetical protein
VLREISQTGNIKLREFAIRLITVTTGQPPRAEPPATGTTDRLTTTPVDDDACPVAVYGGF